MWTCISDQLNRGIHHLPASDPNPMVHSGNLNFRIYSASRDLRDFARNTIPEWLVPPQRDLRHELSIAITTFNARYENLFKPLYRKLTSMFPEVQIIVGINGQANQQDQKAYITMVEKELIASAQPNHVFIVHDEPVGLSRIWNELLAQSHPTTTLILNDDLVVRPWFRRWAEMVDWKTDRLIRINHSWSHFSIPRSLTERVGFFDDEFPGIGFEDLDYEARLYFASEMIANLRCAHIRNLNHHPEKTSFDHLSERTWGKYTSLNEKHFYSKWERSDNPDDAYIPVLQTHVRAIGSHSLHRLDGARSHPYLGNTFFPDRAD
jgi:hypothetical protein